MLNVRPGDTPKVVSPDGQETSQKNPTVESN
jgi:hypothetical protein